MILFSNDAGGFSFFDKHPFYIDASVRVSFKDDDFVSNALHKKWLTFFKIPKAFRFL